LAAFSFARTFHTQTFFVCSIALLYKDKFGIVVHTHHINRYLKNCVTKTHQQRKRLLYNFSLFFFSRFHGFAFLWRQLIGIVTSVY